MKNESENRTWSGTIVSIQPRTTVWRYRLDNCTHSHLGYNLLLDGEVNGLAGPFSVAISGKYGGIGTRAGFRKEEMVRMDGRFEKVVAVKRRSHRSWNNLYEAAGKQLGLAYSFGTDKVEKSSVSYLAIAVEESGMSAAEIRTEIEKRDLLDR